MGSVTVQSTNFYKGNKKDRTKSFADYDLEWDAKHGGHGGLIKLQVRQFPSPAVRSRIRLTCYMHTCTYCM